MGAAPAGGDDVGFGGVDNVDLLGELGQGTVVVNGQQRPADTDLDSDDDLLPDSLEGTGHNGVEPPANAKETVAQHTHAASDWGSPGKQHRTVNNAGD